MTCVPKDSFFLKRPDPNTTSKGFMQKLILVIGGAGYIGSAMVRTLLEAEYQPVVFDNLSTGHRHMVPSEAIFVEGDLQNPDDVEKAFKKYRFSGVMHFAASSIVPESVKNPLKYYRNNTAAFLNLLDQIVLRHIPHLIFSSTAAVYGEAAVMPISERAPVLPLNPYGSSKLMMERILEDTAHICPLSYVVFRYFNAAGAHHCGDIGESHDPETHLIPNIIAAVTDKKTFTLCGDDYSTRDGTCVRDYIHVEDLCRGHLMALQYLEQGGKSETFNLGSEKGFSVKEVVKAVERVTQAGVNLKVGPRRPGDPAKLIADSQKAKKILGWQPRKDLLSIIQSACAWHQNANCEVEHA